MQIFLNIYFLYNLRINILLDIFIKVLMLSIFKCMFVNFVDKCMLMKIGVQVWKMEKVFIRLECI